MIDHFKKYTFGLKVSSKTYSLDCFNSNSALNLASIGNEYQSSLERLKDKFQLYLEGGAIVPQ